MDKVFNNKLGTNRTRSCRVRFPITSLCLGWHITTGPLVKLILMRALVLWPRYAASASLAWSEAILGSWEKWMMWASGSHGGYTGIQACTVAMWHCSSPRERWSPSPQPLKALHGSAHHLGITSLSREQAWASRAEDMWSIHPCHPGG